MDLRLELELERRSSSFLVARAHPSRISDLPNKIRREHQATRIFLNSLLRFLSERVVLELNLQRTRTTSAFPFALPLSFFPTPNIFPPTQNQADSSLIITTLRTRCSRSLPTDHRLSTRCRRLNPRLLPLGLHLLLLLNLGNDHFDLREGEVLRARE